MNEELKDDLIGLIEEWSTHIIWDSEEEISLCIAETNSVFESEYAENIKIFEIDSTTCRFTFDLQLTGEPRDDDVPFCGDKINAFITGTLRLDNDSEQWHISEKYEVSAEIADWRFDGEVNWEDDNTYIYEAIEDNTNPYLLFTSEINNIRELVAIGKNLSPVLQNLLYYQSYTHCITSLEVYLSDTLINAVLENVESRKTFVKNFKDFHDVIIKYNNIYEEFDQLDKKIRDTLTSLMYHNLGKISKIYEFIFDVKFPKFGEIQKIVNCRHDLVHRNGKTKSGEKKEITIEDLTSALYQVQNFINKLNEKICKF